MANKFCFILSYASGIEKPVGHPACAELPRDATAISQRLLQPVGAFGHPLLDGGAQGCTPGTLRLIW